MYKRRRKRKREREREGERRSGGARVTLNAVARGGALLGGMRVGAVVVAGVVCVCVCASVSLRGVCVCVCARKRERERERERESVCVSKCVRACAYMRVGVSAGKQGKCTAYTI